MKDKYERAWKQLKEEVRARSKMIFMGQSKDIVSTSRILGRMEAIEREFK